MTGLAARTETWRVNGIDLAVAVAGEGPLVVLAHGFPDLAITWRHQMPALVAAGHRVIAPDMRGYGRSSRPDDAGAYGAREVGLDLLGLLEHEHVEQAHFVGHDWGAACVWQLGLDHPDSVLSLTGLSVPHVLPAPARPTEILRARWGDDFYQVRLSRGAAEAMLTKDLVRSLAAIFADQYDVIDTKDVVVPPTWLPSEVFTHYVEEFRRTGFSGGLNYYRNIDENWEHARSRRDHVIRRRSLFITGSADPVTTFMRLDPSDGAFEDLTTVIVEGAGHWVHQESPELVTTTIVEHLRRQPATSTP